MQNICETLFLLAYFIHKGGDDLQTLQQLFAEKPFSVIISLPQNDIELARAAIEAGADALKFHINVTHFASGNHFEGIEAYTQFITDVRAQFKGPIGVVLGDTIEKVAATDYELLQRLSIQYYSLYSAHIDERALSQQLLEKTAAINHAFPLTQLLFFEQFQVTALELSIIKQSEYGQLLNLDDMLRYQAIRTQTALPLIIPSQKKLTNANIKWLQSNGMNAVMLGAICIGQTADSIYESIRQLTK